MNRIQKLHSFGQSLWYDNIERRLLENGELGELIQRGDIRGVTSNPTIFNQAISKSSDYDAALKPMAWAGWSSEQIFYQLAGEDIRAAADLFQPLYEQTNGGDGYVSLEVSPLLAHDTAKTAADVRRLWSFVARPNLMVKIPATAEGVDAIRQSIAAGINVNVTLIFSLQRYAEVMEAYLRGLEERVSAGQPVHSIASVASFFVSRMDTKVDARLEKIIQQGGEQADLAKSLLGQAGIASTRLAYQEFLKIFKSDRFEKLRAEGARLQRPLWASTSTKNPAYSDVRYVEELIAPDTIDTVPPKTLDAFRNHGEARLSIYDDLDQAGQVLAGLEQLGISIDEVTRELEDEGVASFEKSFVELMDTVECRRKDALSELGPLAESVHQRVETLEQDQAPARLFARDGFLFTTDASAHPGIADRLGWLDLPFQSPALVPELTAFASECVEAGFTHALLLGMGGSSLAPETLREVFGIHEINTRPALDLAVLDSTDPAQVIEAASRAPLEQTLFIVSSKSGGTSEVNAFLDYFWERAVRALGGQAGRNFIAITDPGTALEALARERAFRSVFLSDASVGGRYSALTVFGLLPAALIGIDLKALLQRVGWMASQCLASVPAARNPGLVLGAAIAEAAAQGRDKLTLLSDPEISPLGAWLEQLIAESSGKEGKGIIPVDAEPVINPQDYSMDRCFIYLRFSGYWEKLAAALQQAGHPVLVLAVPTLADLGAEFYRWETAVAYACAVLGINAFDQPDVQDSKTRTAQKVAAYRSQSTFSEGAVLWENPQARLYGTPFPGLDAAQNLAEVLRGFFQQAREGDYVAINAYLPRNPRTLDQLQNLRAVVLRMTSRATTLGFGPRFLHSTGQLHKGGPEKGLFLQITADPDEDLPIPTQGITFGTLERAQALGDLEALIARGRRVLRVHLTGGSLSDCINC